MQRRSLLSGSLAALALTGRGARAAGPVDALIALAVDVSLSITEPRYDLERRGYAEAFGDPAVLRAIAGGPNGRIAVALFEWAGPSEQRVAVDWTVIGGAADARAFADRLAAEPRAFRGRTAIGSALAFGTDLIARAPYAAERRIIDVSGDGTSNTGPAVADARDRAVAAGITVNGIVILTDPEGLPPFLREHTNPAGGLAAYYRDAVIGGEGAFVMTAARFEAFGRALVAKLLREIS